MFEKLEKIKIKGGHFESQQTLNLFAGKSPLSIVYGRNGSGKTTIAKAMRQLIGNDSEQPTDEGYITYEIELGLDDLKTHKNSVFIFDEDFVRENVRTKENGLESIVMLGEQVNLNDQIDNKKEKKRAIELKIKELTNDKLKYEDSAATSSPHYFFTEIRAELRKDGGWADIDRDVKGNSVKSRVTEELISKFLSMEEPEETEEALKMQLISDLKLYTQTNDTHIIEWKPETLLLPSNLKGVKTLLERKIEKPHLTEREQELLSFLQSHAEHYSQDTTRQMTESKWSFCPLCFRAADEKVYEFINERLKSLMNRESEMYREALDEIMVTFGDVDVSLSELPEQFFEEEVKAAKLAIDQLNKDAEIVRTKIDRRKRDLYGVMEDTFNEEGMNKYAVHIENFRDIIKTIEAKVARFNQSVNERKKLQQKLLNENDLLAKKRLTKLLNSYQRAFDAYKDCLIELSKWCKKKEEIENDIAALEASMARTDIALDYINQELQYVFYSDTKVKLVPGNGCYKLQVNGKNVPPKKISVGERNVLGLCYFFAKLFANKIENNQYKDEMLVVIDDPVSSFDYGNRLGVISLLRYQFCNIKKGNNNSRILVLTHELRTVFDLVKIRSELNSGKRGERYYLELINKQTKNRKVSNEYKKLLECVYDYAKNPHDNEYEDFGIGNVMRRVIEAFASFCYNKSFEEMMCLDVVLKSIPEEKRSYYENFMCRLTLNGESHMEERVYDLNTITPYFTRKEKVQTAKSLLLFLSYVNEEHLFCYLTDDNAEEDRMAEIKSWQEQENHWITPH